MMKPGSCRLLPGSQLSGSGPLPPAFFVSDPSPVPSSSFQLFALCSQRHVLWPHGFLVFSETVSFIGHSLRASHWVGHFTCGVFRAPQSPARWTGLRGSLRCPLARGHPGRQIGSSCPAPASGPHSLLPLALPGATLHGLALPGRCDGNLGLLVGGGWGQQIRPSSSPSLAAPQPRDLCLRDRNNCAHLAGRQGAWERRPGARGLAHGPVWRALSPVGCSSRGPGGVWRAVWPLAGRLGSGFTDARAVMFAPPGRGFPSVE